MGRKRQITFTFPGDDTALEVFCFMNECVLEDMESPAAWGPE